MQRHYKNAAFLTTAMVAVVLALRAWITPHMLDRQDDLYRLSYVVIAVMALIVCAYLVVGFAVSLITGVGAALLTIVFLFLMPAFLCVGLMALALARLIHRAALLREDNELTV